jgi:hypothetical protein
MELHQEDAQNCHGIAWQRTHFKQVFGFYRYLSANVLSLQMHNDGDRGEVGFAE